MLNVNLSLCKRTLAAAALAVGFAGCGDSSDDDAQKKEQRQQKTQLALDQTAVAGVITQLQAAAVAGDGKQICTQIFTPKLADSVTKASKTGSCSKEVKAKLFSPSTKLSVENVNVTDAANATATVKEANGNESTIFLVRQSGRWRIRSVQPA
jgi:hypothetical protein